MLKIVYPICCGMDVHKSFIVACIASTNDKGVTTYKSKRFSTFTNELRHCALCAADKWAVSDDWSKIPVGATIYGYSSSQYGHVGIYIGNGKVIHNLSGTVKVQSLESWVKDFKGFAWGWENNKNLIL